MISQPIFWILAALLACALVQVAIHELKNPVTWRMAVSTTFRGFPMSLMTGGVLIAGIFLMVSHLIGGAETRMVDAAEFGTGMTQALERVAYLREGEAPAFREWSGGAMDGSRYALLTDDVGALVRVENLSREACLAALNFLSPYAASVLTMRDERGVAPVDAKARTCPEGEARLQAVFRAPG